MLCWAYCNPLIHRCVFSWDCFWISVSAFSWLINPSYVVASVWLCLFSMTMMMMSCFVFWGFDLYDRKYLIDQINLITSSCCSCRGSSCCVHDHFCFLRKILLLFCSIVCIFFAQYLEIVRMSAFKRLSCSVIMSAWGWVWFSSSYYVLFYLFCLNGCYCLISSFIKV